MRLRPLSFPTLGLALFTVLCACNGQGQGDSCSTLASDCQSPLTCVPIAGYQSLGKCCMPNSQCANTQVGSIVNQDGGFESFDAADDALPADALGDALDATGQPTDATSDVGNISDAQNVGDAEGISDASDGG